MEPQSTAESQVPLNPQPAQQQSKSPAQGFSRFVKPVGIIVAVIIVLLIGAGVYALGFKKTQPLSHTSNSVTQISISPTSQTVLDTANLPHGQLFTGHLQRLNQNLGLVLSLDGSSPDKPDPNIVYYSAGIYNSGKYKGYTRYICVFINGPGGVTTKIFASKDAKTFIFDSKNADMTDPTAGLDKKKITAVDLLESEHPDALSLDSYFSLSKSTAVAQNSPVPGKDQYGNQLSQTTLVTNFKPFPSLKSPFTNLAFYAQNSRQDLTFAALYPSPTEAPIDKYIAGTTKVYVVDSTGLAYSYILANSAKAQDYPKQIEQYDKSMVDYHNHTISAFPDFPTQPDLRLSQTDIHATQPIYTSYNLAIPANCSFGGDTLVAQNIADSDLTKIGSSIYGDIYVLKDKNHSLNQKEFDNKITSVLGLNDTQTQPSSGNLDMFKQINNGALPPSYNDYVSRNPLLFIKDYWGRWVILGEFEYKLIGGCGKPVVYLYPTKPTKVNIQFQTPITFDVSIPTYDNGWSVLADPDGKLTDLQPEKTNCGLINVKKTGSEYAEDACSDHAYPYLYWAGTSTNRPYPVITSGWILARNDVSKFISRTLDSIGFNSNEKADFTSYWVPQILAHNTPFYRISFLQNPEMDEIAPMKATPAPDVYYRYFLDYEPLDEKPATPIAPQNLTKIVRKGFTLIEWGGHLR